MKQTLRVASVLCALAMFPTACAGPEPVADQPEMGDGVSTSLSKRDDDSEDDKDWRMAAHDVLGSGHNAAERRLSPRSVRDLGVLWSVDQRRAEPADLPIGRATSLDQSVPIGPVHTSPVTLKGNVYFGDFDGFFYAADRRGRLLWQFGAREPNPYMRGLLSAGRDDLAVKDADGNVVQPITQQIQHAWTNHTPFYGAAVLPKSKPYVIFGDADGNVYARNRDTGDEVWTRVKIDDNPFGGIAGNSLMLIDDDTLIVGVASLENYALMVKQAGFPYDCCTHRGAVHAIDVNTGATKWRWDAVPQIDDLPAPFAPFAKGPSGADIWGQPTYDAKTNTLYIGTGQSFSPGLTGMAAPLSDSIVALDAATGLEKWHRQLTPNDIWVTGIPNPTPLGQYSDQDFADSPKIYKLGRRTVIGVGQKSGTFHVLDATTGEIIHQREVVRQFNSLGGLQIGGGFSPDGVIQHGLDRVTEAPQDPSSASFVGTVVALSADGTRELWRNQYPASPLVAPIAIANHVVYYTSPVGVGFTLANPTWTFYGIDARSGHTLKALTIPGRSIAGPAIARGRIYMGFGNGALVELGKQRHGGLVCLGLAREDDEDGDCDEHR